MIVTGTAMAQKASDRGSAPGTANKGAMAAPTLRVQSPNARTLRCEWSRQKLKPWAAAGSATQNSVSAAMENVPGIDMNSRP